MNQSNMTSMTGDNYAVTQVGAWEQLDRFSYEVPTAKGKMTVAGKVFLGQHLGLTSCETSLNSLPPNQGIPFYHKHQQNEEMYVVLRGQGEFQVDGDVITVTEGSVLRIAPAGERTLRNTSATEALVWLVVQAPAGQYPSLESEIADGVGVRKRVNWPT